MKFAGVVLPVLLLLLIELSDSQLYSRRRYVPARGHNRFRLTARPQSQPHLRYRGYYSPNARKSRVPNSAALKAGRGGSYEFSGQSNSIIVNKGQAPKPAKTTTTTPNPNKINMESKIPAVTEPQKTMEKANVGGTAILHCFFDMDQIGVESPSPIWWTKQPQRASDRPVILGAGTQIRLPDDRLRLVNYPGESYSILIIRDVLMSDAGDYKCSLPTASGTQTEFTSLQVFDTVLDDIDLSEAYQIADMGSDLDMHCRPENKNLKVWWTAERSKGETIEIESGKKKIPGRELHLRKVSQYHTGTYTCHIQLLVGAPIKKHFTLKVKEKPWPVSAFKDGFNLDTFLSKFSKDPEYGDEVNLRCDSGGIPVPEVTWWFDSQMLINGQKHKIKAYEPTYKDNAIISSLTIVNFSPDDEGRYVCKVSNDRGERQREFTLKGFYNKAIEVVSADDEDEDAPVSLSSLAFGHRESDEEGSGELS